MLVGAPDVGGSIGRPGILHARLGLDESKAGEIIVDVTSEWPGHSLLGNDVSLLILSLSSTLTSRAAVHEVEESVRQVVAQLPPAAEVIAYNVSTYIPASGGGRPTKEEQELGLRAHQLNRMLEEVAADVGIHLIDLDRLTAEIGTVDAVVGIAEYSDEALDSVTEEVIATIMDLPEVGRDFGTNAQRLVVPRFDRRTTTGTITEWHVEAPAKIHQGDRLFEIRYQGLSTRVGGRSDARDGKVLNLSVVARGDGHLQEITIPEGSRADVGMLVGVILKDEEGVVEGIDSSNLFPVGVTIVNGD